jgi:hypothetical protein
VTVLALPLRPGTTAADPLLEVYAQLLRLWDLCDLLLEELDYGTEARHLAVRVSDGITEAVGSMFTDERDAQAERLRHPPNAKRAFSGNRTDREGGNRARNQ